SAPVLVGRLSKDRVLSRSDKPKNDLAHVARQCRPGCESGLCPPSLNGTGFTLRARVPRLRRSAGTTVSADDERGGRRGLPTFAIEESEDPRLRDRRVRRKRPRLPSGARKQSAGQDRPAGAV